MNRPCFSLGVLLSSLAVCLLAVGSANSQTGIDVHAPACLMCPYAGSAYSSSAFSAVTTDGQSDVDYDLDYEADYEADYRNVDDDDSSSEYAADDYEYGDYADSDYDYSDYDYGDYDYSDSGYDYDADEINSESLESTTDEADYDEAYSDYDEAYSDYDYSDDDYSDDDYSDDDYSEYDYSEYGDEAMVEPQVDESLGDSGVVPSASADEYGEFDNYDYEDYFAEVYGTGDVESGVDASPIVEADTESSAAESSSVAADVVADEGVDAFDFFDQETFEPAATDVGPAYDDADLYEGYDSYESDYDLIEKIEEASAEEITAPVDDASDTADAAFYDLHTTYDDIYDEVMGPAVDTPEIDTPEIDTPEIDTPEIDTPEVESPEVESPEVESPEVESPAVGHRNFNTMDHCFGGYADPYRSEYRCDLADAYQEDAYQSFYHDGTDPSATRTDADADVTDAASTPTFPIAVEPYVALVMDRVGSTWGQFSLDAIVSRTLNQVAKLPLAFSPDSAEVEASDSIADYVDCHVDAGSCDPNWCEIDCFGPWEAACPVGSGLEDSQDAATKPAELDAELLDTAALDALKASIRDLRSRMNAARQSPPLR